MAFWTSGSKVESQPSRPAPAVGAAKPITVVLHSAGDFSTLVRLRVKVPKTGAALDVSDIDDGDGSEAAAQAAGAAVGKLHQLMLGLETNSADAHKSSVTQIMAPELLQVLCQKAVVAKIYKSLMPHQAALGFQLGDVKSCISLTPLGLWELHEALQTAVVKALTGNSSGISADTAITKPSHAKWMSLTGNKLMSCDLLATEPGVLQHASFVEFEVKAQPPNKLLLLIRSAGSVKFRLFSPMQALTSDAKALKFPLTLTDTTEAILADPAKLAAAARQLDGRAVKLLPDERLSFVKSLRPAPSDPKALEDISLFWLGHYGLKLPTKKFPFLVGVASHPEAESASLEVPSCCVLTNLGLSVLPGSSPGGNYHSEAVGILLEGLRNSELQLMGGEGFKVEANAGAPATTDAQLQLSQVGTQSATGSSSSNQHILQPKQFSISASWTTASDLSKLQAAAKAEAAAAAGKQPAQQQQKGSAAKPPAAPAVTTAAAAQLMGLQELEDLEAYVAAAAADAAAAHDSSSNRGLAITSGAGGADCTAAAQNPATGSSRRAQSKLDPSRWAKLNEFLADRAKQEQELKAAQMQAAGVAVASSASKCTAKPAAAAAAGPSRTAAGGGTPGVPSFKSRKPASVPAARKPAAAAAAAVVHVVVDSTAGDSAAAKADDAAGAAPAAAAAAAPTMPQLPMLKKAPALGSKRPAAATGAAAKPPVAKKAKAAASADGSGAAGKPKAAKKAAAAATAAAAPAGVTPAAAATPGAESAAAVASADGAAPNVPAAAAAAAAAAPKKPKKDLDVAAVTTKVMAAYAAGGGSSLKGLSVPEMQCYLRANGQKGGPTKKAEVEARLLAFLASKGGA